MKLRTLLDDDRGVSTSVGYMFIIGFVVLVALGLFLFGGQIFTGSEDPRIDAKFDLEIQNTSHIEMYYDTGDDFTTDNTDELYIVGEAGSGSSIDKVMLYNESGVIQSSDPVAKLESGMLVINASRAQDEGITPGARMQIVWEPKGHENLQIVVDEVVVPSENRILQVSDSAGAFSGNVQVDSDGCEPQNGETC
jgi:hypothetical protein